MKNILFLFLGDIGFHSKNTNAVIVSILYTSYVISSHMHTHTHKAVTITVSKQVFDG